MPPIYKSEEGRRAVLALYGEILARWPVPCEQLRLKTSGGETFVLACGAPGAPPLVLLQGSGANAAMWRGEIAALAASYRIYAVDVLGEPGFSAPVRPPLESDAYARWLGDVFDGLGLASAALAGVSLGGCLALDFATRAPDRVSQLVLINPGGIGRQRASLLWKILPLLFLGEWGRKRAFVIATGIRPGTAQRFDPEAGRLAIVIGRHFRRRRVRLPRFSDDRLQRLSMPVVAVLGARDAMLDAKETRRRLAACVPSADIRWLAETGHVVTSSPLVDCLTT